MKLTSTASQVAAGLRDEILKGVLTAGVRLNQAEIAERFGVSKIPIREGLHRLEADGLIAFLPNGSAIVADLTPAEGEELYRMRIALETLLLREALPNFEPIDLVKAENALRLIDHEPDPYRWMTLNWEFHAALYRPAGMPTVLDTVEKLYINTVRYFVTYARFDYREPSQEEHRIILAACQSGQTEAALSGLERHLSHSMLAWLGRGEIREESDS